MLGCGCGKKSVLPKKIRHQDLEVLLEQTNLKEKEVKALYRRFRLLAPNGYLLPDQFRQTMGVIGLTDDPFLPDRMFRIFDTNQDDKLSFFEFASSLAVMIRGSEDEKLKLSFEMTAGKRGARGIRFEDFQSLIRACNTMMESLVTPDVRPVSAAHIQRMFGDLASDAEESEGDPVITFEDFSAAAQSNDDFLVALGLQAPHAVVERGRRRHDTNASGHSGRARTFTEQSERSRGTRRCMTDASTWTSAPQSGPHGQDQYVISSYQMDDLREKVLNLREVVLRDKTRDSPAIPSAASNALAQMPPEDPGERWWTPLPKKTKAKGGPKPTLVIEEAEKTPEELGAEFDKVLGWCDHARDADTGKIGKTDTVQSVANAPYETRTSFALGRHRSVAPGGRQTTVAHQQTSRRRPRRHRLLGPKKGVAVHFGHENWNMVLSMMIGIRMSVGRIKHEMNRELTPVDFIMKEKFSIIPRFANIFDSEVSKRVTMTRFYDYAPMVFQKIRTSFYINHDDYLRSVGPEQLLGNMVLGNLSSLSELSSEGKSGAFFYYTADGKYMLKTVTPKEKQLLKRMLKSYYEHITQNKNTLICRFLGLHCLRVRKQNKGRGCFQTLRYTDKKLHFVVMGNMFNAPFEIHRRYDLKGSFVGRDTPQQFIKDPSVALKDVDFTSACEKMRVGKEVKSQLVRQIENDSAFLRDNNVIDYSLLLGIHDIGKVQDASADGDGDDSKAMVQVRSISDAHGQIANVATLMIPGTPLGGGMGCSQVPGSHHDGPLHQRDLGGLLSKDQQQLYFFGIIDILTPYDSRKRFEHHFKALRHDRRGVSCCPPVFYAERFNDFTRDAFE